MVISQKEAVSREVRTLACRVSVRDVHAREVEALRLVTDDLAAAEKAKGSLRANILGAELNVDDAGGLTPVQTQTQTQTTPEAPITPERVQQNPTPK